MPASLPDMLAGARPDQDLPGRGPARPDIDPPLRPGRPGRPGRPDIDLPDEGDPKPDQGLPEPPPVDPVDPDAPVPTPTEA